MPQVCNCLNTLYSDRIKTSYICHDNSGLRQPREHNEWSLDSLSDLRLLSMLCNDEAKRIEAAVQQCRLASDRTIAGIVTGFTAQYGAQKYQ